MRYPTGLETTGRRRRTPWSRARRQVAAAVLVAMGAALLVFAGATAPKAYAGPPAAMFGFVPLPADQLQTSLDTINSAAGTTLDFTVGITNAGTGGVMYYDHWEDGYEADVANPTQPTTQVWGDGDPTNGDASTLCSTCPGDLLTAGDVFVLRNNITTPRNAAEIRWDGRDKVASTRGFALTSGGWTTSLGSVLAGVVSAYDTSRYGTSFVVPVGQDTPFPAGSSPPFEYTGASIMAAQAATTVQVDADNDGTFELSQTIGAGEAMFVNGGLQQGARIVADKPVQVHLMTGDVGAAYEAHFYTLFSTNLLTNSYINPVASSVAGLDTIVYLFNPNPSAITVTPTCASCAGTIPLAANSGASFTVPLGEAVQFSSGGPIFTAVGAMGAQSGAGGTGSTDFTSVYDWGYPLVPADILTTQVVLGWAPGAADDPPSAASYDPVWATTFAPTTLHVDFDGDPNTGALAADCFGQHDLEIAVGGLESTRITDPSDNSMTGSRIYTCDGTAVAAAWGEDPANAPVGHPGLDSGYAVIPSTTMLVDKTSALAIDTAGDGEFGPGDTVQYSVAITDAGSLAFTNVAIADTLPPGLTYVPGTTVYDDGAITPIADDVSPPAATPFPLDEAGAGLPDIPAGATVFVRFRATVDDPYSAPTNLLTNTADITSDQASGSDTDEITLASSDLSLTKTETASPTHVGDDAVFSVTVANGGPDLAPDVEVTDLLPAGVTYQSHTATQGTYTPVTGLWEVGDLTNGANATLEITARVDATSVENFAEVTSVNAFDPDSQPAEDPLGPGAPPDQDDEDAVTVTVAPSADLSLTKARTAGPDVTGNTTFQIAVTNGGPSTATGVAVTETPDPGAVFVSATPSQGTFDNPTGVWTIGDMNALTTATLDITYTIPTFPATNVAEVSAVGVDDPDSQPAEDPLGPNDPPNQDDEAGVTVTLEADLSLTKVETASPQFVGDNAEFEIVVTNDGPDPASDVEVTDLLPPGLVHVTNTPSSGSYDPGTGVWSLAPLTSGDSATLLITARVTAAGTIDNTAEITASGAPDPDSTPDNADPAEDDLASASVTTTGGSLGDTVFFDIDGNGAQDPGDPGIAGVEVTVTDAGPNGTLGDGDDIVLPPVITDASGNWVVTGLGPGAYRVALDSSTLPAGMTQPTADPDGVGSAGVADVTLSAGQARDDVDFGYTGAGSVGDIVFLDFDRDGVPDADEGLDGVAVELVWSGLDGAFGTGDDVTYAATTDNTGAWLVQGLPAGPIRVTVDTATVPAGVVAWVDADGGNDATSELVLGAGASDMSQDFGFVGNGEIGHLVFRDDNDNGTGDTGEGMTGVSVEVVWSGPNGNFGDGDDHTFTRITDAAGDYRVGNLPGGPHRVAVITATLPSGAENTVDPDGGDDSRSSLTLAPGASDLLQNFGYVLPADTPAGTPIGTPTGTPTDTPSGGGTLANTGSALVERLSLLGMMLLVGGVAMLLIAHADHVQLVVQRVTGTRSRRPYPVSYR